MQEVGNFTFSEDFDIVSDVQIKLKLQSSKLSTKMSITIVEKSLPPLLSPQKYPLALI